jgi:hypothetical protein
MEDAMILGNFLGCVKSSEGINDAFYTYSGLRRRRYNSIPNTLWPVLDPGRMKEMLMWRNKQDNRLNHEDHAAGVLRGFEGIQEGKRL